MLGPAFIVASAFELWDQRPIGVGFEFEQSGCIFGGESFVAREGAGPPAARLVAAMSTVDSMAHDEEGEHDPGVPSRWEGEGAAGAEDSGHEDSRADHDVENGGMDDGEPDHQSHHAQVNSC